MVLVVCTSSDDALYIFMKFHENIFHSFKVIVWTRLRDEQMDGQTDGQTTEAKKICLHPLSGGRHKYGSTYTKGILKKLSAKDLSNDDYEMFLCCFF